MKRLYISYILLAICALVCIFQFFYIYNSCTEFIESIEKIETACIKEDFLLCAQICDEVLLKWKNQIKYIDMFLFHEYVDEITQNFDKLRIFIKNKEITEVFTLCSELKNQLLTLKNSELPLIENII